MAPDRLEGHSGFSLTAGELSTRGPISAQQPPGACPGAGSAPSSLRFVLFACRVVASEPSAAFAPIRRGAVAFVAAWCPRAATTSG